MSRSNYLDNFAYTVSGRVSHNGPTVVLKICHSERDARAAAADHNARFPFGSAFMLKPSQKPVVGKYHAKRDGTVHRGGREVREAI